MSTELWRTQTINLTTASDRQGVEFNQPGHSFQVVRASSASVKITVQVDELDDSKRVDLYPGMGWRHRSYRKVYISWDAQPGESVTVAFAGRPDVLDSTLTEVLPAASANSVTVANAAGDPVPVYTPIGEPLEVSPNGGALTVESLTREVTAADQQRSFVVSAMGIQNVVDGTLIYLDDSNVPGVLSASYISSVPPGKKVVIEDAWFTASGPGAAANMIAFDNNIGQPIDMATSNFYGGKCLGMIGKVYSAGVEFRAQVWTTGTTTVSVSVVGRLIDA